MRFFAFLKERDGQSLIEVMVGLAIGGVLIGAASFAISVMLRSNASVQRSGAAVSISQDLMGRARAWGAADWQNVYGLTKGSGNRYYLSTSGTTLFAVNGEEGVLDNDVTNGLVGEWKFDESTVSTSTTTYDATGNNHNGTLVNSPTRASSTCKISNCLSFNGVNNYVSVDNGNSLNVGNTVTVSAWINASVLTGRRGIFTTRLLNDAGSWQVEVGTGSAGTNRVAVAGVGTWVAETNNNTIGINGWYHIAYTRTGSLTDKIYINGVNQTLITNTAYTFIDNVRNKEIGRGTSGTQYFSGSIDDIRIYNRALSADEVKRLYSSNVYSRYFYAENVCRAVSGSSIITGVDPCGGSSTDDASTQRVTVNVDWVAQNGVVQALSLTDFLTRSKNAVFDQTDWSGGAGQEGPLTQPNALYASGTNVDVTSTPGSFKIQNLYP